MKTIFSWEFEEYSALAQAYGSVSLTEVGQVLGCGAREAEMERDNREIIFSYFFNIFFKPQGDDGPQRKQVETPGHEEIKRQDEATIPKASSSLVYYE